MTRIECRCGAKDKKCYIKAIRIEGGKSPMFWVELNEGLDLGEFSMYLDANALVELSRGARDALTSMASEL